MSRLTFAEADLKVFQENILKGRGASKKAGQSKYKNIKTVVDGIKFDSLKESRRYGELKLLEKAGKIANLKLQEKYPLIVNKVNIGFYKCDFRYEKILPRKEFEYVIEDVKSAATKKLPVYRIKKKLVKALYGIEITEV